MRLLTFDVEEWFHIGFIEDKHNWAKYEVRIHKSIDRILSVLENRRQKATFFCLGWIATTHPAIIKRISAQGHQIGCHSNEHELVFRLDRSSFKQDTERAIKSIEDVIGEKVTLYRAPGFSFNENTPWAFEVLAENNIEIDCSIFPVKNEYGGLSTFNICEPFIISNNGYKIKEFPMNTIHYLGKKVIFSGGGYFRLLPYPLIRYWIKKSDYVMTYFHPRDFDQDQPILHKLPIYRKFKSYIGLNNSFQKFEKLLIDFQFININEADKQIDWNSVKTIKLA